MSAKDQMIDEMYFIRNGGEMGKHIHNFDWCKTPLGPIQNWPANLRSVVNLCLHSRFPMDVLWGETHINIYNDAYREIIGPKHPGALGAPVKAIWPEISDTIGPMLEKVLNTGNATWSENQLLLLHRNGFDEETYFTFSYSPIEGENGKVDGVFCVATETTEAVTGARQLQTLTRLNKNILSVTSDHDVYQKSMEAIRQNPEDFPFAILYAVSGDGKKLLLADQTTNTLSKFFPAEIDLCGSKGEYYELVDAAVKNVPVICTDMKEPFGQLAGTNGEQTPVKGLVLPVAHSQQKIPYAVLKVGINPYRIFDNKYQLFFELVANQIANGINKSRIAEMRNAIPGANHNIANPFAVKELLDGNDVQVKMAHTKKYIEQQFGQLLEQAPVAIALLRGPGFIVDIMNEMALDILGKPSAQLMNKPLFESIPELKKQGFENVVNRVFTTGKGVTIEETPVQIFRHGKEDTIFARIVFKALYEENGTISGVMAAAHDITEHVTVRKKIEANEAKYRQLVHGISIALYTCDKEGRILLYNDAAVELWGREPEVGVELFCGSWKIFDSNGKKLDLSDCPMATALKTGRVESYEIIIERPDGTRRQVMPYPQLMFDDNGNITGAINLLMDITENKKVMAALQQSEARFSNIISQLGAGIAQTDTNGKFIAVNDKYCQLVGLSKKRLLQMNLKDVVYPEDLQNNLRLLKECIEDGKSFTVEKRYVKPDGSLVWVNNSMSLIKGADNQKFLTAVSIDITEAKKMEARLTESENRFRNVANNIPALIWIANAEGHCVYLNNQWYDYTGQTEKEALGDGWLRSVHPLDGKITLENFFNAKKNETTFVMEFRLKDRNGNYRWFLNSGVPHYDEDGIFQGYIGSCTDITDNKKLSQQKDEFMGVVSHELKTPVTSLKAFTQLLEMKFSTAGNQNASAIMRRMDTQINKLNSLISDLLDITRLDEGKIHFKTEAFAFSSLVTETVEELQRISPSHTITTEILFDCMLEGDRERIGQVLTNFITNAVKYSPKANTILVRVVMENNSVICSVKDFGIGIDKSKQSLIFNRFYRVDGDQSDTFPGLGLGLYISAEIIKRQHGTIGFESEPGKGSVFYFSLPVQNTQ